MRCDHCPIQGHQAERSIFVTTTTLQPPIIRRWGKLHKMRITLNSLAFYRIILLITWARYPVRFKFPATCTPFIVPYPYRQEHRNRHRIEGHDADAMRCYKLLDADAMRCQTASPRCRWMTMLAALHRADAISGVGKREKSWNAVRDGQIQGESSEHINDVRQTMGRQNLTARTAVLYSLDPANQLTDITDFIIV